MGAVRRVCRNVKRWQDAAMALRWTSAAMLEEVKGFGSLKSTNNSPHCERPWQLAKPTMPSTEPLNRLLRPRNLLNRQRLPSKFQLRPGQPRSACVRHIPRHAG